MSASASRVARRVLLIGWDGADWKFATSLMDQGLMPNLERLVERGVMGNLSTLQPALSPILWTSIATGKYGDAHGVLGFVEPNAESGGVRPVRSTSRQCKALWNILSDHGLQVGVIHWLASHPAEAVKGFVVSEQFIAPIVRSAADPLRLQTTYPPDLIEGLQEILVGPRDVEARQLYPFVNVADEELLHDDRLMELTALLSRSATTHAAATLLMQTEDWDFLAVYYEGIDRFAHSFMDFHPPQRSGVSDEDFARFRHVMNGCYRYHDMVLGRLMDLAGEDTLLMLVSDHGSRSDDLRPEGSASVKEHPVDWHAEHGLLAAAGGGLKQDELVFGASLLDIAPTLLAALGVPVPDDMPGQVLAQMWPAGALQWDTVPTHEAAPSSEPDDEAEYREDPAANAAMLQRLIDLGYLQDAKLESALAGRDRALAAIYASSSRDADAVRMLERVLAREPADMNVRLSLARCLLRLGETARVHDLTREVLALHPDGPRAHLLLARAMLLEGDCDGALEHLRVAEEADARLPGLHTQLGYVQLRRGAFEDAERAFARALEIDPQAASAHSGMGMALRELGRLSDALDAHMRAVSLLHQDAEAHLQLGITLAKTGQADWAITALETALRLDPHQPRAHAVLAEVYHWLKPDAQRSMWHEARATELSVPPPSDSGA